MASATDVANFFIEVFKDTDDPMTKLRVMKMVYNAQGCSLARFGEPLFDEEIEAWKHGPVIPSIYRSLDAYKNDIIKRPLGKNSKEIFSQEQTKLLIDVAVKYGKYTTSTLDGVSRSPESPWGKAYIDNRRKVKIPKELIREYFSIHEPLKGFDIERAIEGMKPLGPPDPKGNTVFSKVHCDL